VDTYEKDGKTYVRVVDYKTGSREFSYDDLRHGLNLQLLIYLFSVCRTEKPAFLAEIGEELIPAGALYYAAKPPTAAMGVDHVIGSEEGNAQEERAIADGSSRSGIMLSDTDLIVAQDPGLTMKYVPRFSISKSGAWKLGSGYRDAEGMEELFRDVSGVLCEIGASMKTGDLAPNPSRELESCEYCRYKMICRSAIKTKKY
jgi:ATP-dependent helicase/nuclease subunit B